MASVGMVQYVEELLSYVNATIKDNGGSRVYSVHLYEREKNQPLPNAPGYKKLYYGTIALTYTEDNFTYLIYRSEYIFHNLTEKRSSLLWKERLCTGLLYEALGSFIAIAQETNEYKDKPYNPIEDHFIVLPVTV